MLIIKRLASARRFLYILKYEQLFRVYSNYLKSLGARIRAEGNQISFLRI